MLFDPAEDGLDFYESMEGMLVQMNDLVATSFTFTNFGEIFVVGDNGANATSMTPRGGLVISPGDLNPERMVIDDEWFNTGPPPRCRRERRRHLPGRMSGSWTTASASTGSSSARSRSSAPPACQSATAVAAGTNKVSIATFNVENLAGNEPDAKYNTLAG